MLLEKYAPQTARGILGNYGQIQSIRQWMNQWKKGKTLLVYGPTGSGKSASIRLVAKELGFDVVESHASDYRDKAGFEELLSVARQSSVFGRKKILLVEDIELVESKKSLYSLINNSLCPVVLVSEGAQAGLMKSCTTVRFDKIPESIILSFLKRTALAEKLSIGEKQLTSIAKSCSGDVRAALIDLEFMSYATDRERTHNIFDLLRAVFRNDKNAKEMLEHHAAFDTLLLWIDENMTEELKTKEEIAGAYDYLSKADVMRARIAKRQSWNLQKYVVDLVLRGVAASRTARPRMFVSYRSPWFSRKMNKETIEKIAKLTHTSKRTAVSYVHVVRTLAEDKDFLQSADFDEDDIEFVKKVS